ncbi:MAG: hypothetical protein GY943_09910 [Chloroflexi bacterium]|nr:hypothetical protein [Chloroflexota bacterium]
MSEGQATIWTIVLFALRCVVPIMLTMVIGYLMNKLVDKWEAEEAAQANFPLAQVGNDNMLAIKPALGWCWEYHGCGESNCPAYMNTKQVCWQMKMAGDGRLAATCQQCGYYADNMLAMGSATD